MASKNTHNQTVRIKSGGKTYTATYENTGIGHRGRPVGAVTFRRSGKHIGSTTWTGTGLGHTPSSVPRRIIELSEHWLYRGQEDGKRKTELDLDDGGSVLETTRNRPKQRKKTVARTRNIDIGGMSLVTVGLLGLGGYLGYRYLTQGPRKLGPRPPGPGPIPAPPPPQPGVQAPDIPYEAGGESVMTLPAGSEFVVTWDQLSPWRYIAQDTDTIQAVDSDEGSVRFHVARQLPSGAVDQVYVQAVGENDEVLGEHKFSVLGP